MSAKDIAIRAYDQAIIAAEIERQREADAKAEEEQRKEQHHREAYEAALPLLEAWFPGVKWTYSIEGDFRNDTILTDANEKVYPPSFKLCVSRYLIDMNAPQAGYRVSIKVGDYVPDRMSGYSYFAGNEVSQQPT